MNCTKIHWLLTVLIFPIISFADKPNVLLIAVDDLNAYLDALMVDEDILPEQLALFGFSQGTMMALHVAPRREDPIAGVVAISGRLLEPALLVDEVNRRMPVMFVHGDNDEVVPPQSMPQGVEGLQAAGFKDVYAHIQKGTGHGICLLYTSDAADE